LRESTISFSALLKAPLRRGFLFRGLKDTAQSRSGEPSRGIVPGQQPRSEPLPQRKYQQSGAQRQPGQHGLAVLLDFILDFLRYLLAFLLELIGRP
jgi:hypothetical protein